MKVGGTFMKVGGQVLYLVGGEHTCTIYQSLGTSNENFLIKYNASKVSMQISNTSDTQ